MGRDLIVETRRELAIRFNPRARVGRDSLSGGIPALAAMFQSTRPRGARPSTTGDRSGVAGFNPRARVGRDRSLFYTVSHKKSFNPRARVGRDLIT